MANLDTEKLADEVIDKPTGKEDELDDKDVKPEEPDPADPSPAKQEDDPKEKEIARLKRVLAKRNEKIALLEKPKPDADPEPEPTPDPNDPLATREGWIEKIEQTAQKAVAPLLESNFRKARDRFITAHPEYRTPEKKEELTSILNAAKASGKADEEEIFDVLGQAWGAANWKQLQDAESKATNRRKTVQAAATSTTAPTDSNSDGSGEFSEEEMEEAAKFGKTPAQYRAAAKLLKQVSH